MPEHAQSFLVLIGAEFATRVPLVQQLFGLTFGPTPRAGRFIRAPPDTTRDDPDHDYHEQHQPRQHEDTEEHPTAHATSVAEHPFPSGELLIINELRERELSVGDLCEALDLTQSNASQHLAILRDRGVVTTRREGTSVIYALRGTRVIEAVDLLRKFLAEDLAERGRLGDVITTG